MAELWQALINNSGAVIALFTIALVFTTIVYVVVSAKLLKQSKNAFLADMVLRMMEIMREDTGGRAIRGWARGYREAFLEVDKQLGTDLIKFYSVGLETVLKVQHEEEEKQKKENKKNKESGTS